MRRGAALAALVITVLVSACASTSGSTAADKVQRTPLPSGLALTCTDRYDSVWSMGPTADGNYVHYVCHGGKVTRWWVDENSGTENAPPGS